MKEGEGDAERERVREEGEGRHIDSKPIMKKKGQASSPGEKEYNSKMKVWPMSHLLTWRRFMTYTAARHQGAIEAS